MLDAALRDARVTMQQGNALWLATLGYLIVLEMLGRTVAKPNTAFPNRTSPASRFVAGTQEFAIRLVTRDDARALYGLRCALAHEYGLRSAATNTRHLFALDQTGPLVRHPTIPWATGTNPTATNQTWVNVLEVGRFVEEIAGNVRTEHDAGRVELAPDMDAMQLQNFGQFLIT
jgi:hypothetical protein